MKYVTGVILIIFMVSSSYGQNLSFNGFVQGNYTARVTGVKLFNSEVGDYLLGEERIQFSMSGYSESGNADFFVKTDFVYDAVIDKNQVDIREAYIDYIANSFEVRIGKQIITWGVGDLLFINDVFPKDWDAFFSGRPLQYLKIGSDAIKLNYYSNRLSVELLVIPFFKEDALPSPQRFFLYDPFPQIENRVMSKPEKILKNTEVALRLYRQIGSLDISFYSYRGFFRTPGMQIISSNSQPVLNYIYPKLIVYGFSATRGLLQGVLSIETGYYSSPDDDAGTDPGIHNTFSKYLIGYKRQFGNDFMINAQFYGEFMHNYYRYKSNLFPDFPLQNEFRQIVTLRLTKLLKYQTLKLSLFSFYSSSDNDYMVIPEINYKVNDNMWIALGGNIFGGERENTFFGQLNKNDNIYTVLRYEF